jgi:hypothetical protein
MNMEVKLKEVNLDYKEQYLSLSRDFLALKDMCDVLINRFEEGRISEAERIFNEKMNDPAHLAKMELEAEARRKEAEEKERIEKCIVENVKLSKQEYATTRFKDPSVSILFARSYDIYRTLLTFKQGDRKNICVNIRLENPEGYWSESLDETFSEYTFIEMFKRYYFCHYHGVGDTYDTIFICDRRVNYDRFVVATGIDNLTQFARITYNLNL